MIGNISNVAMMQVGTLPGEFSQILGGEFFSYVLPWLLTFAVVYGVLSQIELPKSNSVRAVIGIVLAFIIAPAISPYVGALMRLSGGFIMLLSGLLVVIVLLEVLGLKKKKPVVDEEEGQVVDHKEVSIFEEYPKFFAFILGILAILVFFGSGAADAMGLNLPAGLTQNYPLLFFLGFMVLVVWWMISE